MQTSFSYRSLLLFGASIALTTVAGCLPGASWLPDSSGFVYTIGGKDEGQLRLYDLDKKTSRVVVEKGIGEAWPAVSPDGKRIALAYKTTGGEKDIDLEIVVYDCDGKEVMRSKEKGWDKEDEFSIASGMLPRLFWIPGQDKLLVDGAFQAGTFDLKNKTWRKLEGQLDIFGSSPLRPDGKGYLVSTKDEPFAFVNWDGKKEKIEPKPADLFDKLDKDDEKEPGSPEDAALAGMLATPWLHSSCWKDAVAEVSWGGARFRFDTAKHTAIQETIKPLLSRDGKVIQDQYQFSGAAVIRIVEVEPRYKTGDSQLPVGVFRVEVQKAGERETKTLIGGLAYCHIEPSPDGKKAIAHCIVDNDDGRVSKFIVISANGDTVADVAVPWVRQ